MLSGPNPSITGEAIRKALGTGQTAEANERTESERLAALDEADLRELERAEYPREPPAAIEPTEVEATPRRSILDRLLRR